jgi:hypothetical protein
VSDFDRIHSDAVVQATPHLDAIATHSAELSHIRKAHEAAIQELLMDAEAAFRTARAGVKAARKGAATAVQKFRNFWG